MISSFIRSVASFKGETDFEKARLRATYKGDSQSPSKEDLCAILETLKGNNPDTAAVEAINTIMTKVKTSESRIFWTYILKNLIVLDRALEETLFVREIAEFDAPKVENFSTTDPVLRDLFIHDFVRLYYRFIKTKAKLYSNECSVVLVPKRERTAAINRLEVNEIFTEINRLFYLFNIAFEIVTTSEGHLKFQVNQYIFLLLLSSLVNFYNTWYMCMMVLLDKLFEMSIEEGRTCMDTYRNFIKTSEMLHQFIENHRFIEGFEAFNISEFKPDPSIANVILSYLHKKRKLGGEKKNKDDGDLFFRTCSDNKDLHQFVFSQANERYTTQVNVNDKDLPTPGKVEHFESLSTGEDIPPLPTPEKRRLCPLEELAKKNGNRDSEDEADELEDDGGFPILEVEDHSFGRFHKDDALLDQLFMDYQDSYSRNFRLRWRVNKEKSYREDPKKRAPVFLKLLKKMQSSFKLKKEGSFRCPKRDVMKVEMKKMDEMEEDPIFDDFVSNFSADFRKQKDHEELAKSNWFLTFN